MPLSRKVEKREKRREVSEGDTHTHTQEVTTACKRCANASVVFAGESSDRRSARQRHREGAAGASEAGNGMTSHTTAMTSLTAPLIRHILHGNPPTANTPNNTLIGPK